MDIVSAFEGAALSIGLGIVVKGEAYKFVSTVFGKSADLVAETIENEVKCFNAQRTAIAIAKSYEILKAKGLKPQEVQQKLLIPLLENISVEDDEVLQEMWKNLLVSAISGNKSKKYIEILKLLDGLEANVLNILFDWKKHNQEYLSIIGINQLLAYKSFVVNNEEVQESIIYLIDIGLCQRGNLVAGIVENIPTNEAIGLTITGHNFMKAVTGTNL